MNVIINLVVVSVEFYRSIMHLEAYGKPVIAAFLYGSDMAFCGVLFAIWVVKGATVEVRLVGSKARVAADLNMYEV